jgi:ABC-type transport system involved in multi-copper enzyme maturation permease subunit
MRIPHTYRHDLRLSFTSRAIIAVAVLSVLAGAAAVITVGSGASSFSIMGSALYYYDDGAYHFLAWAYDAGGAPVSGVVAKFTLTSGAAQNITSGPYTATSDSQGELSLDISAPDQASNNLTWDSVDLSSSRSVTVSWGGFFYLQPSILNFVYLGDIPLGVVRGVNTLTVAGTDFYSAHTQAMVFAAGPNGTLPSGISLETCSSTLFRGGYGGESGCTSPIQVLGTLTGYWTHFPLGEYPANASFVLVQLVNESGGVVQSTELSAVGDTGNGASVVSSPPGVGILRVFAIEASLFLPTMAVVAAYWTYARPRLSGTVEPVLAGPVTRRGLLLARYASVAGVLVLAAVVEVSVLDASASAILAEPLPVTFLAPLVGGLLVAALGSAGLVFLIAHLARTTGAALGGGIAPVALGFFWSDIVLGLLVFNNPNYSALGASTSFLPSQLFFPPQFPDLTTSLLTGVSSFGTPIGGSDAALEFLVEAIVGIVWVVVPILIAYQLATTRD